jgi:hypothetical protein
MSWFRYPWLIACIDILSHLAAHNTRSDCISLETNLKPINQVNNIPAMDTELGAGTCRSGRRYAVGGRRSRHSGRETLYWQSDMGVGRDGDGGIATGYGGGASEEDGRTVGAPPASWPVRWGVPSPSWRRVWLPSLRRPLRGIKEEVETVPLMGGIGG